MQSYGEDAEKHFSLMHMIDGESFKINEKN